MNQTHGVDLTILAIPAFIALMIVESIVCAASRVRGYERKDTAASLAMGLGNVLIDLLMKGVAFTLATKLYLATPLRLDGSSAAVWCALLVATDFLYYWFHRVHHEVRFFWAAHVNHHSSRRYNLSTALRQSWTTPLTSLLFYWPLPLLGFAPASVLSAVAINTIYQFWIHTELIDRIGPLEAVLNTPSHHRVHHGANVEYLDRNYGGMLIVWDRLFGTFEPERAPVRYGLTKDITTYNPLRIAFHEWTAMFGDALRASSLAEAAAYLLQAPGWSPDGVTLTAQQMRARAASAPVGGAPAGGTLADTRK